MTILRRLLPFVLAVTMLAGCGKKDELPAATPTPAPTATAAPTPAPTETPESALAMATASSNATKDAPQVTDPTTWNEEGKALMERLAEENAANGMTFGRPGRVPIPDCGEPGGQHRDGVTPPTRTTATRCPLWRMVCSGGTDTPTGYWTTPVNYDWRLLMGPSYGQYATRIYGGYLFHSVPYYSQHKDDVEYDQFNQLGTIASLGCIRLAVVDVKWIYDNCPIGTPVVIYDDEANPGPMGKPGTIYTDPSDETKRGWDPTDPDPANPWDDAYETGTAIRSQAALGPVGCPA